MELLCIAEGPGENRRGVTLYCRGEHLTGLLGGAENTSALSFLSVFHRALVSVLQDRLLLVSCLSFSPLVSSSLSSPTSCHIYHLTLPALTVLHPSLLPCHPQWFTVLSHGGHRINLYELVVWLNVHLPHVMDIHPIALCTILNTWLPWVKYLIVSSVLAQYLPAHVFLRTSSSTLATLVMDPSVMMKTWRGYERCMGCWYTQDNAPSRLVPLMSALILWTYSYACMTVTCMRTQRKRCCQIYNKAGRSEHQTTPVQLRDVACANIAYVVKINPLFDIRFPNYPVRIARNWISVPLIKREQTYTH